MEKITVSVLIKAEKRKVWDCYTNPEHIVHWNFADSSWHCPKASNELKAGGQFFARMEAKDGSFGFDFAAVYTEVNFEKNFTYTFGGRYASVEFRDQSGQTELIVTFDPETENPLELQKNGWQAILNNFKTYTETT